MLTPPQPYPISSPPRLSGLHYQGVQIEVDLTVPVDRQRLVNQKSLAAEIRALAQALGDRPRCLGVNQLEMESLVDELSLQGISFHSHGLPNRPYLVEWPNLLRALVPGLSPVCLTAVEMLRNQYQQAAEWSLQYDPALYQTEKSVQEMKRALLEAQRQAHKPTNPQLSAGYPMNQWVTVPSAYEQAKAHLTGSSASSSG